LRRFPAGELAERLMATVSAAGTRIVATDSLILAEAGPTPHLPADDKVVAFNAESTS
jgi:hypothetical protein